MPKSHRPYPPEFRQRIVELVRKGFRKGRTPEDLARQFEPSAQAIRNWAKQADLDAGQRTDGLTTEEREELRRLRRENRVLREEREILKKAAAWFARRPARSRPRIRIRDRTPGRPSDCHHVPRPGCLLQRVLRVAKRPLESMRARGDVKLSAEIQAIHRESRDTYGAPRIHAELADRGIHVGRKRVARLMRAAGLQGVSRRKAFRTTVREETARPAPDLVDRQFAAAGPDRLWVADITYVPTWAGFLFLAVVVDAWSRRVVGWAMETHLRTELVLAALDMAVAQRRPLDVIHHSDQGCQSTSVAFGKRCRDAGVGPSMGSVGDAYDNALCESFFATLECELLDRQRFRTQVEARLAIFDFIEGWYKSAPPAFQSRLPVAHRL